MAKPAKPTLPDAYIVLGDAEAPASDALIRAVMDGWQAKQDQDAAKAALDAANARIIDLMDGDFPASIIVPGLCRASYTVRQIVKITDADKLAAILGERYGDLVKTSTSHRPEERLVDMASDDAEPLQPAIAACLAVSESESVTWRAEKL